MTRLIRTLGIIFATVIIFSCSSVRQVKPLEPGQSAVSASLGGPVTQYIGPGYAPLPMLSVGYNRGMREWLDLEVGWHITQFAFGVLQLDGGVNLRPFMPEGLRPGLIVTPKVHVLAGLRDGSFRAYPQLSLTFPMQPTESLLPYLGIENWFEFHTTREDGLEQPHHWLIAPYAGLALYRGPWHFQLEMRLYTPNLENTGRGPKNIGIGEYGIWGTFVGVGRTFGGDK